MKKIVIFKDQSLLAQGIFSYLSTHLCYAAVYALDPSNPEVFEQVKNLQPDIVILETEHLWKDMRFPIMKLLEQFSALTILEVQTDLPEVNIIRSEHHKLANLDEMVSCLDINEPAYPNSILLQTL